MKLLHPRTHERIPHPSDMDVLGVPALATLTVLESALAMAQAAIRCEHPDMPDGNDHGYCDEKRSAVEIMAEMIAIQAGQLQSLVSRYRVAIVRDAQHRAEEDTPF